MDDALVLAKSKRATERRFVLILVLMDDALVPIVRAYKYLGVDVVLILVLMDDVLVRH